MRLFQILSWPGLLLCLTVFPYLLGKAVTGIFCGRRKRKLYMADIMLTGWILCIGAAEAVHLAVLFLGRPFSDAVKLMAAVYAILFLAASASLLYGRRAAKARRKKKREPESYTTLQTVLFFGFVLVVLYQVLTITVSGTVYRTGDLTVEIVESFIGTDALYRVNPLTGMEFAHGMPLRLKILCLPTLYAFLCKLFGLTGTAVVWKIVPTVTLLGSYLVFYVLADCLFPERGDRDKRLLFMLFTAVLFCAGDYMYGMDGLGLLYSGFRGVTIRNAVLMPYTIGLVLRRRTMTAALCVLAECCIVWTFYGLGACLMAAVLMSGVRFLLERRARRRTEAERGV